jgi:hypothetical protein
VRKFRWISTYGEVQLPATFLSGLFNLGLVLFCWRKKPEQIGWSDWGMLVLATFRMSRMVAYDKVGQAYRSPVAKWSRMTAAGIQLRPSLAPVSSARSAN